MAHRKSITPTLVRLGVQGVGLCFGLIGILEIVACALALGGMFGALDAQAMIAMALFVLPFAVVQIVVSYAAIRHFGVKTIKLITGLVAFFFWTWLGRRAMWYEALGGKMNDGVLIAAAFFIPPLLAYLAYRVVSVNLIKAAGVRTVQTEEDGSFHIEV